MGHITEIIGVLAPVAVLILIGMFLRKKSLLSPGGVQDLKTIIVNVCMTSLMFSTFSKMQFDFRAWILVVLMGAVTLIGFLLGGILKRVVKSDERMFQFLCTTIEGGMLGFPLFIMLFGQENLYRIALLDLGHTIVLMLVLLTILKVQNSGQVDAGFVLKSFITPINFAIFSGIIFSVTGLGRILWASDAGAVLGKIVDAMTAPASTLILIVVGYGLSLGEIHWKDVLQTLFFRVCIMVILCVVTYLITAKLFPEDALFRHTVILAFILPPSYIFPVFINENEEAYVGCVLALSTVITMAGFIVLTFLVL